MKRINGARIALAGLLALGLAAPGARGAAGGPHLVLEVTKRDLGPVKAGDSAKLRFPLKNTGKAPLRILEVKEDCGCVKPTFPRTVAPGASASIDATFDPEPAWSGHVEKGLTLRTNDPTQPELKLAVIAEVVLYVKMEPRNPLVQLFERGKVYQKDVVLTPRAGSKLGITNATCDNPLVKVKLIPPTSSGPDRAYKAHLTIGPVDQPGDFTATVKMSTTEPRLPEAWLVVAGLAQTGPVVNPREVLLPGKEGAAGEEFVRMQVFTRGGALKLLGVDTGTKALKTEIKELTPGHMFEVVVRAASKLKPGPLKTVLKVRTDDKLSPVVSVPFSVTIK